MLFHDVLLNIRTPARPARRPRPMPEAMPAGHEEHGDRWLTKTPIHHGGAAARHLLRWFVAEAGISGQVEWVPRDQAAVRRAA